MKKTDKDGRGAPGKEGTAVRARVRAAPKAPGEMPGWTNGLRQLYDQVVDEDLPDSFRDLLARLDDPS